MNTPQQAARDRAVAALQYALGATQAGSDLSAIDLAKIVDDIILAAQLPGMTAHEAAVEDLRREARSGGNRLHLEPTEKT